MNRVFIVLSMVVGAACASPPEVGHAGLVVEAPGASGTGFGDPQRAVNGVHGGGLRAQSLDVYSVPPDSYLVVSWDGRRLIDGPGADLVVFENPFDYGDTGDRFMDPAVVEVSTDGEVWTAFPFRYLAERPEEYSPRPADWSGFAGVTPVLYDDDLGPPDPFGEGAGGDRFDLADLPDGLHDAGVRFVRLSAASGWTNPDIGEAYPRAAVSDGIDIDGVVGRTLVVDDQ